MITENTSGGVVSLLDETAFARTTPYVVEEVSKRSVDNGEMTKIRFQQHVHRPIFGSHSQRGDAYTLFSDGELLKVYKHQPPGRPPTELVALQDFTSCFECDEESLRMIIALITVFYLFKTGRLSMNS